MLAAASVQTVALASTASLADDVKLVSSGLVCQIIFYFDLNIFMDIRLETESFYSTDSYSQIG